MKEASISPPASSSDPKDQVDRRVAVPVAWITLPGGSVAPAREGPGGT
jgi:hypothetical protein